MDLILYPNNREISKSCKKLKLIAIIDTQIILNTLILEFEGDEIMNKLKIATESKNSIFKG